MNKIKIIALIGKSGAGKDTILKSIVSRYCGINEIISCTTRPPREKEVDGINYYFISKEEFLAKVLNGEMLEATVFNDWCYGTSLDSLKEDTINIGVFSPAGIEALLDNPIIDLKVFYIQVSDKTRLIRQLNRETNPNIEEIFRRYKTDEEDFLDLDFSYIEVENEDLDKAINFIANNM